MEKAGNLSRARAIVRYAIAHVTRIRPIVVQTSEKKGLCTACGSEVWLIVAVDHVARYHAKLVLEHVYSIIDRIERDLRSRDLVGDRA